MNHNFENSSTNNIKKQETGLSSQLPTIEKYDSGDIALEKMWPIVPVEMRKYVLWEKDIPNLFRKKEILKPFHIPPGKIIAIVLTRVSTGNKLQDIRSPIKQAQAAIRLQDVYPELKILGCILDFFKDGRTVKGRMFWDKLISYLEKCKKNAFVPIFNAIYIPEISRLSRRCSKIFEVAELCRYYGLKLIDKSIRYNLADPRMIHSLASQAAESENETNKLGQRLSESEDYRFSQFRTLYGNHFGFRVENVKGKNNRTILSSWKRIPIEINTIKYLYDRFPINPVISNLRKEVKETYGIDISAACIKNILTTKKYMGIVFRKRRYQVVDFETETSVYREEPIPKEILDDLSKVDVIPYKYYIPDLDIINIQKWRDVQEIFNRRRCNIPRNDHNKNRACRPAREHGKTPFSGLLICGYCNAQLVLYGPSNTSLFACSNKRKKLCNIIGSVRLDTLYNQLIPALQKLLCGHIPIFFQQYRIKYQSKIKNLETQKSSLNLLAKKKEKELKKLIRGFNDLSNPTKNSTEIIINGDTEKLETLKEKIKSLSNQIIYLSKNWKFSKNKAEKWLNKLDELIQKNPKAANEALRQLIECIEVHGCYDEYGKQKGLEGRLVLKCSGLYRFFKRDFFLRNFIKQGFSTDQVIAIASSRSVETLIIGPLFPL